MYRDYQPRPDGTVPAEDDSLLRQPADEVLDDPDTAADPDADQRARPQTPARDEAAASRRM